jgi:hypothetical protein
LGLRLDAKEEDLMRNKELIKQAVVIPALGLDVKIEIIDEIYVKRYKKS